MFLQYGFLYLILTRPKFVVCRGRPNTHRKMAMGLGHHFKGVPVAGIKDTSVVGPNFYCDTSIMVRQQAVKT